MPNHPLKPQPYSDSDRSESPDSEMISIPIPSRIFKDRAVSVLEAIVEYMKDELDLTFHDIAKLLNRDDRTVWTCYSRTKKKRQESRKQQEKEPGGKTKNEH
ncbi:hypothetical protein GF345_01480 [Candidatus Woesearchaeota archaeon]|nr:hypothetical protein [Candidatus Woesearchaeota archaeon]